jgi:hypothetical protein
MANEFKEKPVWRLIAVLDIVNIVFVWILGIIRINCFEQNYIRLMFYLFLILRCINSLLFLVVSLKEKSKVKKSQLFILTIVANAFLLFLLILVVFYFIWLLNHLL